MYVYKASSPTCGPWDSTRPDGKWEPESDHDDREEAAKRVAWLNGSGTEARS